MAKKTVKKVDTKKVTKAEVSKQIRDFYESLGVEVENGVDYGFTDGTLVLKLDKCDLQVKLITPKSGVDHYEKLVDEEEEETEKEEEAQEEK
jgi:hypothetical protein